MPRKYPPEVRRQVIELARSGTRVAQLVATFDISEATIYTRIRIAARSARTSTTRSCTGSRSPSAPAPCGAAAPRDAIAPHSAGGAVRDPFIRWPRRGAPRRPKRADPIHRVAETLGAGTRSVSLQTTSAKKLRLPAGATAVYWGEGPGRAPRGHAGRPWWGRRSRWRSSAVVAGSWARRAWTVSMISAFSMPCR